MASIIVQETSLNYKNRVSNYLKILKILFLIIHRYGYVMQTRKNKEKYIFVRVARKRLTLNYCELSHSF